METYLTLQFTKLECNIKFLIKGLSYKRNEVDKAIIPPN